MSAANLAIFCFEVVHFLPDRRSRGRFVSGFRAIREQRRHLLGVFSKGRIDLLYFGQVEGPLALDHLRTDLRLRAALFHQGLALVDDIFAALRRGRGHAEQNHGKNNKKSTKHRRLPSRFMDLLPILIGNRRRRTTCDRAGHGACLDEAAVESGDLS